MSEAAQGRRAKPGARPNRSPQDRSGPWRITFDTNPDDCNLHCVMCEDHSPYSTTQSDRRRMGRPKRRMDIGLIRRIIEQSRGTGLREIIPSTMGEPLLYRHFDEILDLCADYGVKLNLTTNGTFPIRGARAWAKRIVPVTSDMKVSWNGATKATHEKVMLGSDWESVLENVRAFISVRDAHEMHGGNRCRVTFQLTFMQMNVLELPGIVRLAADLGVDRVKGHHLWVHFSQLHGQSMRRDAESIDRWNAIVDSAYEVAERNRLRNGDRVLLENIFRLDPNSEADIATNGECPFLGQEAWVASDGRFNPCCAPDTLRRTLGYFGNVYSMGLYDIWKSTGYGNLKANYMKNPLCKGCNMRRPANS